MSRQRAILLFFPLCRTVKASEKMGQRRVAKSPAVPYEPLCDFLCFSPAKKFLPFSRESEITSEISSDVNGAFYRGHYRKLDYFTSMELVRNCFDSVHNNICRKKLYFFSFRRCSNFVNISYNYWNILLTLFLLIYFNTLDNVHLTNSYREDILIIILFWQNLSKRKRRRDLILRTISEIGQSGADRNCIN